MNRRLVTIACSTFLLFSLLIVQYFKIQITDHEKWSQVASRQHELIVKMPFRRGAFYAGGRVKKGEKEQPLVIDVIKFHLMADPQSIPHEAKEEIFENLRVLGVVEDKVQGEFDKKSRSRCLAMWLSHEQKGAILSWWKPYCKERKIARNALFFVTDYKRSYPFGRLLGQVLHTIRERKDETTQEAHPTGGLESYFNEQLKGKLGKRKLLRSPRHRMEIDQVIEPPEDGADIYLTINHNLQAIVEEELEKGVLSAQAKGGWAVMLEPHTGEVLALAQYPFFEPERYRTYFNDEEKIGSAKVKALTDAFELGSIMKPITLGVCFKANEELVALGKPPLFSDQEKVDTTRSIFPGRAYKPLKDPTLHKAMNMYMAIQKSSNVYPAQMADRIVEQLGAKWYRKTLEETFGFAQKTGLELPAEATGILPTPGRFHPSGAPQWSKPTPYSLSFGYNALATSLQMVRAYAIFANGGYLVQPTLVKRIVKRGEGQRCSPTTPRRVLSQEVVAKIVRAIKFTTKPGGTGVLAEVPGYTEAGKTGTAEKVVAGSYNKKLHYASFVGFAPAEEARFVLIVTLDEPAPIFINGWQKNYMASRCAAPIFGQIARRTLAYMGVTPNDPHGYDRKDPRYDEEKADWICEVKQLKELYDEWNR